MRLSFLMLSVASLSLVACNQAKFSDAPDASPNCGVPLLIAPCKPQPAGTAGCGDDLNSAALFNRDVLLDGGSYPPACGIVVYDVVPDEQNQCIQLGICRCDGDGGVYNWVCLQ